VNIFVCIKEVPDYHSRIVAGPEGGSTNRQEPRWAINPEDECAIEQAVQLKEEFPSVTVTALRIGHEREHDALIYALAMGADDAILVRSSEFLDPYRTAKALVGAIKQVDRKPDLILCGTESSDYNNLQVPQTLAQLMGLPCVTRIVEFSLSETILTLRRLVSGGSMETYQLQLPAVVACSYGLNVPRYAPLPRLRQAEKKPFNKLMLEEVGVSEKDQRLRYSNHRLPPVRSTGKRFDATDSGNLEETVNEVVDFLRADIKSI